jgi:hypothetical protein
VSSQGLEVLALPVHRLIDADLVDPLRIMIGNWNGEPLPALSGLDSVAVLKLVLLILDRVEKAKGVATPEFVHIAQPGEELGLMDGYDLHIVERGVPSKRAVDFP